MVLIFQQLIKIFTYIIPFAVGANVIWRRFYAEGNKLFYLFVVAFYLLFFFAFSAFIVGFVSDKFKGKLIPLVISMVIGILVCYAFGTAWFAVVYNKANDPASLATILGWCELRSLFLTQLKLLSPQYLQTGLRNL